MLHGSSGLLRGAGGPAGNSRRKHVDPVREGMKAFRRLQETIVKRNIDLTIFAKAAPESDDKNTGGCIDVFGPNPGVFLESSGLEPFP